jgi:Flp pilus assembly protein TadG
MNRLAARRRLNDNERGSISIELAILAPIVGLLLVAVVAVGRVQNARADVEGAARSAARDLSIARDPQAAIDRVRSSTADMVRVGSPGCRQFTFDAQISESSVSVNVVCVADLDDASILPLPGSINLTGSATEVIDVYREPTA